MKMKLNLAVLLALGYALEATHAQTNSWINSGSGKWEDATKWSLGLAPTNTQSVFVTNAASKTVTLDATTFSTKPASTVIHDLTLSAPVGNTTTLSLSGLTANSPLQILGSLEVRTGGVVAAAIPYAGGAIVVDQAGVSGAASNGLTVGFNTQGEMRMNGGQVTATLPTFVGLNAGSSGTLTVIGGTNQLPRLFVGYNLGATGAVWVTGDARVSCSSFIIGGPAPGSISMAPGGVGQITISNGAVSAANGMIVGGYVPSSVGTCGTLTIAGGTLELNDVSWVGYGGSANGTVWLTGGQLVATNSGGAAYLDFPPQGYATITIGGSTANSQLTVSNGSLWARSLWVYSRLTLAGGTMSLSSNLSVAIGNTTVSGGALYVTNAAATASLRIASGTLALSNGLITADTLYTMFAGSSKRFTFSGGTLTTKGTGITNGAPFAVGDGTNTATFQLNGGFHSFSNLVIATNSLLTGCGTVIGPVTNQGTIAMTCPSVFSNTVVNSSSFIVSNDVTMDFYGPVINNGIIDAITGTVNFHSTFVNNGLYLDADGDADGDGLSNLQESLAGTSPTNSASTFQVFSVTSSGDDMLVSWQAGGGRTNVVEASADLAGCYTNLSDNIILPGSGDVMTNYLDVGGATNVPARFYRIRLVP